VKESLSDNKKHIDDLFREEFKGFELPVNDADLAAIRNGLKQKRKRRPVIWWFVLALLISVTGYFIFSVGESGDLLSDNSQSKVNTLKKDKKGIKPQAVEHKKTEKNDDANITASDINIVDHGTLFSEVEPNHNAIPGPGKQKDKGSSNGSADNSENTYPEPEIVETREQKVEQADDNSDEEVEEEAGDTGDNEIQERRKAKEEKTRRDYEKARWETERENAKKRLENTKSRPPKSSGPSKTRIPDTISKPSMIIVPAVLKYSLGFSVITSKTQQSLSQENTAHASYAAYKGSNEQNTVHFDYGLTFQALYKNSLALQAGVNWAQYKFDQTEIRYQTKDSFPYKDPNGIILYWIYRNYRDTTNYEPSELKYQTVAVPLSLAKVIELNSKWTMFIKAGTQVSFMLRADGKTVNSALDIRNASDLPLKNVHIGWNGSLGVAYRINSQLSFRVDGDYRNLSSNLYKSTYDAKAVLNNVGLKTSLMYELGKKK
jgi:hypothetical protein